MTKQKFNKPPLSHELMIEKMINRGLFIENKTSVKKHLENLNYYRLSAYFIPLQETEFEHKFKENTSFKNILNLYNFDRKLRLLILDSIEKIEVSIKSTFSYKLSLKYNPHFHLDKKVFKESNRHWNYFNEIEKLEGMSKRSKEVFIEHFSTKYKEKLSPVWATVEIMTFGSFSKWYSNLKETKDRTLISKEYGLKEFTLSSFLRHLATVRNFCAHHSRLYNRNFIITFQSPKRYSINFNIVNNTKIYNTLAMIQTVLNIIDSQNQWKNKLFNLIEEHEINLDQMGFPKNYKTLPIWKNYFKI